MRRARGLYVRVVALRLVTGPANSGKAGEVLGAYRARLDEDALLVVPRLEDVEHSRRELAERGVVLGARVLRFGGLFELIAERADRARLRERARRSASSAAASAETRVRAQIPGRVVAVLVAEGETVDRGQRLLSVEAMKMENDVAAPRAGTIGRVSVQAGDRVELGDELVVIR